MGVGERVPASPRPPLPAHPPHRTFVTIIVTQVVSLFLHSKMRINVVVVVAVVVVVIVVVPVPAHAHTPIMLDTTIENISGYSVEERRTERQQKAFLFLLL